MLKSRTLPAVLLAVVILLPACEPTSQGYEPDQPIKYSHAVHAGSMEIPCQYCHFGAERGRYAGIPPASICMNCHSQVAQEHPEILKLKKYLEEDEAIQWVRVHQVPDHVYFNHSAHVTQGVDCTECHGPVANMGRVQQWAPLTMGWCLDCHRSRGVDGASKDGSDRAGPLTDCSVCHH